MIKLPAILKSKTEPIIVKAIGYKSAAVIHLGGSNKYKLNQVLDDFNIEGYEQFNGVVAPLKIGQLDTELITTQTTQTL